MSAHEQEMFLRNALRAAAESVEPRSDGIDRIHARLRRRPYPLPVAWAQATWTTVTMWLAEGAYAAGRQVASKLRSVSERFRAVPEPATDTLRSISAWFYSELPEPAAVDTRAGKSSTWSVVRPLAAFGVAVFIVALGAYAAMRIPAAISSAPAGSSQPQGGGHGGGPGNGNRLNHRSSRFPGSGPSGVPTASASQSTPPTSITKPTTRCGGRSRSATPTATPTQNGSSPSPTGSGPSSSSSPSPTPTSTGTPSPNGTSAAAGAGQPTAEASAGAARAATDAVKRSAKAAAPSVQTSKSPCGMPSPGKTKKHPTGLPTPTLTTGFGESFTPSKPARHPSSSSA